jgi:endonuclease G
MYKKLVIIACVLFFCSPAFADNNQNKWSPDSNIPDIYRVELFTFHGFPHNLIADREIRILVNSAYAVCYSEELKIPLFAVYRYGNVAAYAEGMPERYFERPDKFQVDLRTKSRVHTDDYTGSGFDRGHMAPNFGIRNQYGHIAQLETFLMTNIVPQRPSLNRYTWKDAEHDIASSLSQQGDISDLWIISGVIFQGELNTIGDKKIAIPTGFYKIIVHRTSYTESSAKAIAIYYPHEPKQGEPKYKFVSIDYIEELTKFDFHPNLIDSVEDRLEKQVRGWDWQLINN